MSYELSNEAVRRAREAFEQVLDASVPAYEIGQLLLFHDDDEAYIRKEVERKLYDPLLPHGGSKERKMVERFKKLARDRDWLHSGKASFAASQWEEMLPDNPKNPGRYYVRRPLAPRTSKEEFKAMLELLETMDRNRDWEKKWFAREMLDGLPEAVSNFVLECLFLLRGADGMVTRLVRLKNILGETSKGPNPGGSEILEARAFCAPEKFREWCLSKGNFNWGGNQKELQMLHEDVARAAAWKVVTRIDSCGWHPLSRGGGVAPAGILDGIWFFDECAYGNRGGESVLLWPNEEGIIEHGGESYYLGQRGREAEFVQGPPQDGRPKMRPKARVEAIKFDFATWENKPEGAENEEVMRCFFRELCAKTFKTLGSYEGWLALGSIFGYAAGPEIYRDYNFCAGLWVHGQAESGKTLFTSWLMAIWGFQLQAGIGLLQKTSTAVGLLQQQENYSYLPLWVDEFRAGDVPEDKLGILRNAYDRAGQAKWSPDGISRQLKTGFLVSGESTSSDAATRGRYAHVQVSATKRMEYTLGWFMEHAPHFYLFGRLLLERRKEFVERFRGFFKEWLATPDLKGVNDRERMVHGVSYAGWMGMEALLNAHFSKEVSEFKSFMIGHLKRAATDVTSETNINVFWSDLVTAFREGEMPVEYFRFEKRQDPHPPGARNLSPLGKFTQGHWWAYQLYMEPEPVLSALNMFMAKRRATVALKRKDLRDQLSKTPYWIEGKLRKRFGRGAETTACWGIELDKHPMGYQGPVSDQEYDAFLLDTIQGDPRKGPLYAIVHALEDKERAVA